MPFPAQRVSGRRVGTLADGQDTAHAPDRPQRPARRAHGSIVQPAAAITPPLPRHFRRADGSTRPPAHQSAENPPAQPFSGVPAAPLEHYLGTLSNSPRPPQPAGICATNSRLSPLSGAIRSGSRRRFCRPLPALAARPWPSARSPVCSTGALRRRIFQKMPPPDRSDSYNTGHIAESSCRPYPSQLNAPPRRTAPPPLPGRGGEYRAHRPATHHRCKSILAAQVRTETHRLGLPHTFRTASCLAHKPGTRFPSLAAAHRNKPVDSQRPSDSILLQ